MLNYDPCTVYVFIRQDLSLAQQLVQSNHATFGVAMRTEAGEGSPFVIMIGVPDVQALERVERKLIGENISHYCWREPDLDLGFTSIATWPLTYEQKKPLAKYRLWNPV